MRTCMGVSIHVYCIVLMHMCGCNVLLRCLSVKYFSEWALLKCASRYCCDRLKNNVRLVLKKKKKSGVILKLIGLPSPKTAYNFGAR